MNLSLKLKNLRKNEHITQEELTKKIGINLSTYKQYETNRTEPDIETLKKIADYFDVSLDYLCDRPRPNFIDKSTWSDNKKELLYMIENLNDYECEKVKGIIIGCTQAINEMPKRIK